MCLIDMADGPFAVYVAKQRVARVRRHCNECHAWIEAGDTYRWSKGLFDRRWTEYRICLACFDGPCAWLSDVCGGWLHHGVHEDLDEHWSERWKLGISAAEVLYLGRLVVAMDRRRKAAA
jgi:hypothetical protein